MKLVLILGITFLVSVSLVSSVQCGISAKKNATKRFSRSIIDGENADVRKWPWQVLMIMENTHNANQRSTCGGTIISDRWILTAAHCMERFTSFAVLVFPGVSEADQIEKAVPRTSFGYLIHPNRTKEVISTGQRLSNNDMALIKLNAPLVFGDTISPICLPKASQFIPDDAQSVATGFGKTRPEYERLRLREVSTSIVNNDQCRFSWLEENVKSANVKFTNEDRKRVYGYFQEQICSGNINHGVYKGDSGGPLVMKATDGRWIQVGVASGISVNRKGIISEKSHGLFMDVRKYCGWIEQVTLGEAKCLKEEVTILNKIDR